MAPASTSSTASSASTFKWSSEWQEASAAGAKAAAGGRPAELVPLPAPPVKAETASTADPASDEDGPSSGAGERSPAETVFGARDEEYAKGASPSSRVRQSFEHEYALKDLVLGTGVSGSVREAVCRKTGRAVAVKSFKKQGLSAKTQTNLRREVDVHAAVSHPHIVRLEGAFESEESVHLVMEKLEGGELFDRVLEVGRFTEAEAAKVAIQLLDAVAYLHARRMTHRDIKPENLMYVTRGGSQLKLIDFGFATRMEPNEVLTQRCGTLQYVAPEVLAGVGYNETGDLWSVGSVTYTLLTGKAMYSGEDPEILRKNKAGLVDYSRTFKARSPAAQEFVNSLLCVDPQGRPSALQALAHPWLHHHAPQEAKAAEAAAAAAHAAEAARASSQHEAARAAAAACEESAARPREGSPAREDRRKSELTCFSAVLSWARWPESLRARSAALRVLDCRAPAVLCPTLQDPVASHSQANCQ